MKKRFFIYFVIGCILIIMVWSCNSFNLVVEHKVSLQSTDKGNELSMGHLFINNKEIPPFFELVIVENQIYQFILGGNPSNEYGYWPENKFQLPPINIIGEINEQEIERGWYFSDLDKKKASTPGDWIWIKSGDLRAYVDAKRLPNFIQTQRHELKNLEKS